jgi:adenine-specific DNA-methyltransferase
MAEKASKNGSKEKRVTRYSYDNVKEPRAPETGHTALLPADEQVVTVPMDNGWSKAIKVAKPLESQEFPVVLDMDPAVDPVLFWAGKRSRRQVPILPLQRNEIVSDSRIAHIIDRARKAAAEKEPQLSLGFAELEKALRESDKARRVEFYTHDEGWKNKQICGDSLHVMESLLYYDGIRGQVQMIYFDPPYGIKYDSNFQQRVDSTKNDDRDKADDVLSIKAFRDTWALGVHSYLSYLSERLYLCREMLNESGSIFVQISDENVHLVRTVLDEVFGKANSVVTIVVKKKSATTPTDPVNDYLLWYAKDKGLARQRIHTLYLKRSQPEDDDKFNTLISPEGKMQRIKDVEDDEIGRLVASGWQWARVNYPLVSQDPSERSFDFKFKGKSFKCGENRHWTYSEGGMKRLAKLGRVFDGGGESLGGVVYWNDWPFMMRSNVWDDIHGEPNPLYAVQTSYKVVERCISMTTDPGDLVFDPTCGSGTTAYCAEKLGRRWITCDTSRVAMNVARKRLLGATFVHFKTRNGSVASGFLNRKVPRVTLKSLAYDLEPEPVELFDEPEPDKSAVRVAGPFEVMSLGRYSAEDWKGYVTVSQGEGIEGPKLENYIQVICRLYRKDAAVQGANGFVHAVAESEREKIAISVGPLSGRVTGKQVNDAVQDALASGILEVHILGLGWTPRLRQPNKTLFAVRCKIVDRQDHCTAF